MRPVWTKPSPRAKAEAIARRERKRAEHRDTSIRDLYFTPQWRTLRRRVLREEPICRTRLCGQRSAVVDHVRPHRGDLTLFFDRTNLAGMCKQCHDRKTARYDGGFGNPKRT